MSDGGSWDAVQHYRVEQLVDRVRAYMDAANYELPVGEWIELREDDVLELLEVADAWLAESRRLPTRAG